MKLAMLPDKALSWLRLVFTVPDGQMVAGGLLLVPLIVSLRSRAHLGALRRLMPGTGSRSAGHA